MTEQLAAMAKQMLVSVLNGSLRAKLNLESDDAEEGERGKRQHGGRASRQGWFI